MENNFIIYIKKIFRFVFITLIVSFFAILISGGIILFFEFHKYYNAGIDMSSVNINTVPHIYDNAENEISVIYNKNLDNTVYTNLDLVPDYVYNAFVAIEDKRFYIHNGYDVKRLFGATFNYLTNSDSYYGASTITQQLVRLTTNDNEDTPSRKIREVSRAIYVEDNYSKKKILEMYLNIVNYGYTIDGIYTASNTFFGLNPESLNISQAAALAAIINSPTKYSPYTEIGKEKLLERKNLVLDQMYEQGYISSSDLKEAKLFNLVFEEKKVDSKEQYINLALDESIKLVAQSFKISDDEALKKILNSNTKIYTNLDYDLQKYCYDTLKSSFPSTSEIESGFIVTTKDGKVITAISSRKDSSIDHVKQMNRQVGSCMKPIGVYGPAFELGIYKSVYDLVIDSPANIKLQDGTYYNPLNYYNSYKGSVTVQDAIANSINTIAVKTLYNVTIPNSIKYLKNLGISTLTKDDEFYPLALGGLSKGISPFEMTRAYNTINNNGIYTDISFIEKIEIDNIVITPKSNTQYVFSTSTSDKLKQCLNYAVTNGIVQKASIPNVITYAKTGTTSDNKDLWLCGFTDDVTASLWIGYDQPSEINYNSGDVSKIWSKLIQKYYKK